MSRFLLTLCGLLIATSAFAKDQSQTIRWSPDFPPVPDKEGFAGPFAGIVGSGDDRWLVFGGGANFPQGRPWEKDANGNKPPKVWYDSFYAIQLEANSLKAKGDWKKLTQTLPEKLGYGSSVHLPHHNSCLFIGGNRPENGQTYHSPHVYEVTGKGGSFTLTKTPDLPVGVSASGSILVGKHVYVFSGASINGSEQAAWVMDTSQEDRASWVWKTLPWPESAPGVKARARQHHTVGEQDGKLYVFAGRTAIDESIETPEADRYRLENQDYLRDCYVYTPGPEAAHQGKWKRIADLPMGLSAAAQHAMPSGVSHLLLLGGIDVHFMRQQYKDRPDINGHGYEHPGFPAKIHAYHTITNTWVEAGSIPLGSETDRRANNRDVGYATVTVPLVIAGKEFLIPSGEIKPGVRTPQVLSGVVEGTKIGFGIINWIVVILYLSLMVGIGYWFMKHEAASSTDAYFRGGQKIPWWAAGLSIFATMLSAITFMAIPGASYATDWNAYISQWPILLIVPLVVFFYLPFYRKLNVTTAYEYLEKRFNVATRVIASITFMLFHIGRIAIVLYLPALALSSVTNINILAAIAIIGVLCVLYTVMGGIQAVIWTDAIQAVILMGGAFLCFGLIVSQIDGGLGSIGTAMTEQGKGITASWQLSDISFSKGSTSAIVLFIAYLFANLPTYTAGQDIVQRYVSTASEKDAARSLWMNIFLAFTGATLFFALGTALYVFYQGRPELLDPAMPSNDGILPYFILQNLPIGVAGLIVAGVFAAAQSTVSSSLNSVATTFVTDIYARLLRPESSDQQRLRVARNVVIILGGIGMAVSGYIALTKVDSAFILFNTFIGFALGPLGGVFALGIFTKHSSGKAGLLSMICGVLTVSIIHFAGLNVMPLLYGFFGFMSTFLSGIVLGFFFPAKAEEVQGLTILTNKE